jgi:hypothetical protein
MTILENTIKEVLESDKEIIERLTKELDVAKDEIKEIKKENVFLHQQIQQLTSIQNKTVIDNNNIENSEIFIEIKKERDKYKEDFDNINLRIQELENKNMKNIFPDNNSPINIETIEKNIEEKIIKIYVDKIKILENDNKKLLKNNNELLKKIDSDVPISNNKINNDILKLPDNLLNVVYYRNINDDKYLPSYLMDNNKIYLKCCGKELDEITNEKYSTCSKCYKSYILSFDQDILDYKIYNTILKEHIIPNEKDLSLKIKCNKCDFLYKKEIDLCIKCKNVENIKIVEYPMPDINDETYETKLALAGKCHNTILYTADIYSKAYKEGLIKNGWKPLINYIKDNKLMEEKQINIIKNKIIRCGDIKFTYELDKYRNIQNYIKRLSFSLNSIAKLKEDDYYSFKYDLIKLLDENLEKTNIKNSSKEKCIKCSSILKSNNIIYCNKCTELCQINECIDKKQLLGDSLLNFCKNHMMNSMFNI